jgi:hypothetical protein
MGKPAPKWSRFSFVFVSPFFRPHLPSAFACAQRCDCVRILSLRMRRLKASTGGAHLWVGCGSLPGCASTLGVKERDRGNRTMSSGSSPTRQRPWTPLRWSHPQPPALVPAVPAGSACAQRNPVRLSGGSARASLSASGYWGQKAGEGGTAITSACHEWRGLGVTIFLTQSSRMNSRSSSTLQMRSL